MTLSLLRPKKDLGGKRVRKVAGSKVNAWNSPERCITARGIHAINQMLGNEKMRCDVVGSPRWPM